MEAFPTPFLVTPQIVYFETAVLTSAAWGYEDGDYSASVVATNAATGAGELYMEIIDGEITPGCP